MMPRPLKQFGLASLTSIAIFLAGSFVLADEFDASEETFFSEDDLVAPLWPLDVMTDPEVKRAISSIRRREYGDEKVNLASWKKNKLVFAEAYAKAFAREFERDHELLPGAYPWREVFLEFSDRISRFKVLPKSNWDLEFWDIRFPLRKRALKMIRPAPEELIGRYYPRPMIGINDLNLNDYRGYSSRIEVLRRLLRDFSRIYVSQFAVEFEESRGLPTGTFGYRDILRWVDRLIESANMNALLQVQNAGSQLHRRLVWRARDIDQMGWQFIERDILDRMDRLAQGQGAQGQDSPYTNLIDTAERLVGAVARATSGEAIESNRSMIVDVVQLSKYQRKVWFFLFLGIVSATLAFTLSQMARKR